MDEDVMALVLMASTEHLRESVRAGGIADDLESFLMQYPDAELRRKSKWMVKRLRSISESAE